MRKFILLALALCLLLSLPACGKKTEADPPAQDNPPAQTEAPQTPGDSAPQEESPSGDEEFTLYNCGGLTLALPKKLVPQLAFDDGKTAEETSMPLMRVYEQASLDAAEAEYGDSAGFGFLFEISEIGTDDLETWQGLDLPGSWIFARDDEHYYIYTEPTDVQLFRQGEYTEEDLANWETLSDLGSQTAEDMITRNGLTPWGESRES